MKNNKNNVKKIAPGVLSGVIMLGALAAPANVLADTLVPLKDGEGGDFIYKKHGDERDAGSSEYLLRLKSAFDSTGAPLEDLTEENIKEASKLLKPEGNKEYKTTVGFRGVYELENTKRQPGFYLNPGKTMNKDQDDNEEKGFEFPKDNAFSEAVGIKESELLAELQVILQNQNKRGLNGAFELTKIANPKAVYGKYTQAEMERKTNDQVEGYAKTESDVNSVSEWEDVSEKIGTITTSNENEAELILQRPDEEHKKGDNEKRTDITEGIYQITQTKTDKGYQKRPDIFFKVTVDETGLKPVLYKSDDPASLILFSRIGGLRTKAHEQFELDEKGTNGKSLYQALLVNFTKPGWIPGKPGDGDPARPDFNKGSKRVAKDNKLKDAKESEKLYIEGDPVSGEGDKMKINRGEKFEYNFEFTIPENTEAYEEIVFHDKFDEKINIDESSIEVFINGEKIGSDNFEFHHDHTSYQIYKEKLDDGYKVRIQQMEEEESANIEGLPENTSRNQEERTLKNAKVEIRIKDVFVEGDAVEDIDNQAFLYMKKNKYHNDVLTEYPEPKDNETPNPEDPIYKDIPKTPIITVDPINTKFRVGIVDQTTNLLNNSVYKIKSFKPTRGTGELKDGKFYIDGTEMPNIPAEINVGEDSFIKLENLPAGEYVFEEATAPDKDGSNYRLVTNELRFVVQEDEKVVTINTPIVENGNELTPGSKDIDTEKLYQSGVFEDNSKVVDGDAMIHHYKYIDAPATGTLARVPFFLGGGIAVAVGATQSRKKRK